MTKELINFKEYFNEHILKIDTENEIIKSFFCARKNNSAYWFRVIFAPYHITIYGDIGNLAFHVSDYDSLKWLLSTDKKHIQYLMSKVPSEFKSAVFEFSHEKALSFLDEQENDLKKSIQDKKESDEDMDFYDDNSFFVKENIVIKECEDKINKILSLKDDLPDISEEEFYQRLVVDLDESDLETSSFKDYTSHCYFIAAALFKFCKLYKEYKEINLDHDKNIYMNTQVIVNSNNNY
ncbi:hypothetical protein GCL60_16360 [Silvanigrella paludirubra]|uniref:Uncharacterized protein n=1 Tax=Silvanigrella paludirubra TaxID=2499159 RepID=A0A6N6VTL8_9BACT|nr:hypothetical protein [Silvanigrella paludirubra]KAB8035801.1 hypothetical protein GCL60_16360 [Silvanigrella paludirubra]